jgi:hypothetical protein
MVVARVTGLLATLLAAEIACVYVPPRGRAAARSAAYFSRHVEVTPAIAKAIQDGHILVGMNAEQVWVVLGDPIQRRSFDGSAAVSIWLYPAHKLHQDQLHSHGASSFRLTFIGDRLELIEPI